MQTSFINLFIVKNENFFFLNDMILRNSWNEKLNLLHLVLIKCNNIFKS